MTAVPFTEDFEHPGKEEVITFTADSFNAWARSILPMTEQCDVGDYTFDIKELPTKRNVNVSAYLFQTPVFREQPCGLELYNSKRQRGFCRFDNTVYIPRLCDGHRVWMSLTPNEVLTQRKLMRLSKGDVGIAGLGLGWLARRVIEKPTVTAVTVYERDAALIDFFGKALIELGASLGKAVTLVNADAYKVNWSVHTSAVWDIWPNMGDAAGDWRYWKIQAELQEAGVACHAWFASRPSNHAKYMLKRKASETGVS